MQNNAVDIRICLSMKLQSIDYIDLYYILIECIIYYQMTVDIQMKVFVIPVDPVHIFTRQKKGKITLSWKFI